MNMTKKDRAALLKQQSGLVAHLYRDLAAELQSAANALDHSGELHAAYPAVSADRFAEAIKAAAVMHYIANNA